MKRIIFVGAHPDDIEIACAGLLCKIDRMEYEIKFIICSKGENGGDPEVRENEVFESYNKLKINCVETFEYPDGEIPVNNDSVSEIQREILEFNPDIVFTHYPEDTHQDHRAVSKIVQSICYRKNINLIYYDSYSSINFNPNLFTEISFDLKESILECFPSQLKKSDIYNKCRYKAEHFGYLANCNFAEGFIVDKVRF